MNTRNEIVRKELKALREMQMPQTKGIRLLPIEMATSSLGKANALILGPMGSGKSFISNLILTDFLTESKDNRVVIIDFGGSYKKLCRLFNGQYFEIEQILTESRIPLQVDTCMSVFNLYGLQEKSDMQPFVFSLVSSIIENNLKFKPRKTLIILDECATIFHDETGLRFIRNLYDTARKFNAMLLCISQSPKNFLDTPVSDSIIANTSLMYVLQSTGWSTNALELLPEFGLNQEEIKKVKNLRASKTWREIFIKFGDKTKVTKIEPSKIDYWICTTAAADWIAENKLREQHPEWSEIQMLKKLVGFNI